MVYLSEAVGNGLTNRSTDIRNVKRKFSEIDLYNGDHDIGYIDRDLDSAIKTFQERKGLKVDGVMFPGGETEKALAMPRQKSPSQWFPYSTDIFHPVGNGGTNNSKDVQAIQTILSQLGVLPEKYRMDASGIYDRMTHQGIKSFQEKNNLKSDSLINPDGETIKALKLADNAKEPPVPTERPKWVGAPIVNLAKDREESLLRNTKAQFEIKENLDAVSDPPIYELPNLGTRAVKKNDHIIIEKAEQYKVDPDMLRALMWAENARGGYAGLGELADKVGLSDTIMPMNVDKDRWGRLAGKKPSDMYNSEDNIETAAVLVKRIENRVRDATPEKVGSIWVFSGAENVSDYGSYIGRIYEDKPWLKSLPIKKKMERKGIRTK